MYLDENRPIGNDVRLNPPQNTLYNLDTPVVITNALEAREAWMSVLDFVYRPSEAKSYVTVSVKLKSTSREMKLCCLMSQEQ